MLYSPGTRLYREPASKSNRSIILNAIEYVVFPGVVNAETRNRVLVRFLVLFEFDQMIFDFEQQEWKMIATAKV